MNKIDIETAKTNAVKFYLRNITQWKSIQKLCENINTNRFRVMLSDRVCDIIEYVYQVKSKCSSAYWPVVDYIKHNNRYIIDNKHGETSFEIYGNTFPIRIRLGDFVQSEKDSSYFIDIVANTNKNTIDDKQCSILIYDTLIEMFRCGLSQNSNPELLEFAKNKRYSENNAEQTLSNIITLCNNSYQDKLASYLSDIIYINFENDRMHTKWQDNLAYTALVKLYNTYNDFRKYKTEDLKDAIAEYKNFGLDYDKFSNMLKTGVSELESKFGFVLADCQYNAWQQHRICIRSHMWIHNATI